MATTDKIASILKEYTKKHRIMASHVILEDYAEELVKNGLAFKDEGKQARNITQDNPVDEFICSECGVKLRDLSEWRHDEEVGDEVLCEYECKFCPECGARVKREDT